jgi:hypothetical protein
VERPEVALAARDLGWGSGNDCAGPPTSGDVGPEARPCERQGGGGAAT